MKIVICHMGFTGYTAACWKALSEVKGVELRIYTPETRHGYDPHMLDGLSATIVADKDFTARNYRSQFLDEIVAFSPDVIVIGGWSSALFSSILKDSRLSSARKLLQMDTMWEWNVRCLLSRFRLWPMIRRFDGAIVAGERGAVFARYIGFRGQQIYTSSYGYDATAFSGCFDCRNAMGGWPRQFVFVGRFVPIKGLDALIAAYRKYRQRFGSDAWELHCFGKGPLETQLSEVPGIVNRGFLQPKDLPAALTEAGVFVLPSLKDPWGVALAEGAGAGLPLIASDEVSSSVDLLRHRYNGYVVPAGDEKRLLDALTWMHEHYDQLPEMGRRSKVYAGAYAPEVWADRIMEAVRG